VVPVNVEQGRAIVEIGPQYRTLWYEVETDAP